MFWRITPFAWIFFVNRQTACVLPGSHTVRARVAVVAVAIDLRYHLRATLSATQGTVRTLKRLSGTPIRFGLAVICPIQAYHYHFSLNCNSAPRAHRRHVAIEH